MNNDIKTLIEKYYRGETTLEEEELLRNYFSQPENRDEDPELADLLMMYREFENVGMEEDAVPIDTRHSQSGYSIPWYYSAAASVAFLMVGLFLGQNLGKDEDSARQIASLNEEIREIKSMITYQTVQNLSPSEKIQAAYAFSEKDSLDRETVHTLIDILQFDENINVRLAAADALSKFKNNDNVRTAFLKALKTEENPVLQIKLMDALILSKETKAIPELQRIMQASDKNETVKARAAYGLTQLI